jgi:membrane protein YdbS with pleckstrin-like domain
MCQVMNLTWEFHWEYDKTPKELTILDGVLISKVIPYSRLLSLGTIDIWVM